MCLGGGGGAYRTCSGSVKVNCWFCNQDNVVPYTQRDAFMCAFCDQYNGFTAVSRAAPVLRVRCLCALELVCAHVAAGTGAGRVSARVGWRLQPRHSAAARRKPEPAAAQVLHGPQGQPFVYVTAWKGRITGSCTQWTD